MGTVYFYLNQLCTRKRVTKDILLATFIFIFHENGKLEHISGPEFGKFSEKGTYGFSCF